MNIISCQGDDHYVFAELKHHYIARNMLTRKVETFPNSACVLLTEK